MVTVESHTSVTLNHSNQPIRLEKACFARLFLLLNRQKYMNHNNQHWSDYWESGSLTSLPEDFQDNYEGELKRFWNKQFESLKPESKIVDLCTGNGAIAILAMEFSTKYDRKFEVTGVDAANISQAQICESFQNKKQIVENLEIIGNTKIESLSARDKCYSMVSSQYGIEYCNWDVLPKIVSSLLENDGIFSMVCHGHDTSIIKTMLKDKAEYELLFESGLFEAIDSFVSGKRKATELIIALRSVFESLARSPMARMSELVGGIAQTLMPLLDASPQQVIEFQDKLALFANKHRYAYQRLCDVVNVSSKIAKNPDWYLCFEAEDLELEEKGVIYQDEQNNAGYLRVL